MREMTSPKVVIFLFYIPPLEDFCVRNTQSIRTQLRTFWTPLGDEATVSFMAKEKVKAQKGYVGPHQTASMASFYGLTVFIQKKSVRPDLGCIKMVSLFQRNGV